jgi:hypothetical protein
MDFSSAIPCLPADVLQHLYRLAASGASPFAIYIYIYIASLAFASGLVIGQPELDAVEYFSGRGEVTKGFQAHGYLCYPYELNTNPDLHDILGVQGFVHALALLCRVRRGGVVWYSALYLGVLLAWYKFLTYSAIHVASHCPAWCKPNQSCCPLFNNATGKSGVPMPVGVGVHS